MNEKENIEDVVFEDSTEEGESLSGAQKIKKLQERIKGLEKEKQEYLDGWQRSRADYSNLQKQSEEEKKRIKALAVEALLEEFIPVVDSFLMAMANKEAWEKIDPAWRTGVEYIYNQLISTLETHDVKTFGEVGEVFDPARHEAVSEDATEDVSKDHTVSKIIQKGFTIGEKVFRPARVAVFAKK